MKRATGIELGDDAVTCVRLVRRGRRVRVDSFLHVPFTESGGEREALARVVEEQGLTGKKVALSLPASAVYLRNVDSPMRAERAIRSTIKSQVEALVPVDIDETVVDFTRLTASCPREQGAHVLVVVARKEVLRKNIELVTSAGVRPARAGVNITDCFAMTNVLPPADGPALLLDLGARTCNAIAFGPAGLAHARACRVGADSAGTPDAYTAKIAREVDRMLKSAALGQPDRVLVTGVGATSAGVMPALNGRFLCPVSALDLSAVFMPGANEETAFQLNRLGAAAFGAAHALLCRSDVAPDLLRDEFGEPGFTVKARRPAALCAVTVLLACLAGNVFLFHSSRAARRRVAAAQAGLDDLWRGLYPDEPLPADVAERVRVDRRRLAVQDRESLLPGRQSALDLLLSVVKRMPREKIAEVARVNISQGNIQMDVRATSFSAAQEIAQAVNADPAFSANAKDLKPVGDNTFAFRLSITIQGEPADE
ncbi:MAG: pilus assembly protein PilM [Planctomycetes bacterium]|nr:pilus assembly protein PilM [Planctomycetota bacterium]